MCYSVILNMQIISQQNFAHTPTAMLSGHVQKFVVIMKYIIQIASFSGFYQALF